MADNKPPPPSSAKPPPTITLPPRTGMDNFFTAGVSPGPMTLVSTLFAENDPDSDCRSFSQLLAAPCRLPQLCRTFRQEFCYDADSRGEVVDWGFSFSRIGRPWW
ncbi:hypothetical protein Salat_1953900 [Sesamum alatum]|uniref:Uncharacterized protein n=1 Tax=Sesamum alatum TaxID=300844 RepID=A0AAE2CIT0_9LAMI|nr:hypothetical protein Salat_1953900 [Sesamum alatum]